MIITLFHNIDPLEVCCGDPKKASCMFIKVPSEAALSQFRELAAFPPKDPSKYALKLLSVFITDSELAESNCTRAEGRKLLDQDIIVAIKGKMAILRYYDSKCNRVPSLIQNKPTTSFQLREGRQTCGGTIL